ncbi:MAG: helicase-related protein [Archangium sp.]|nr:helicase-related protein [Archangium sp.]
MKLSEITVGQSLEGVEPYQLVKVVGLNPAGQTLTLFYTKGNGELGQRLLSSAEAEKINPATSARPWHFDGDGADFQLAVEAKRIDLAFLFDPMMAVHTSNVDPLPHQITAVYEAMLPRQPLRFVLADDPGAGKTIMAGLYVRELLMRADARRVLIVAPGSLVVQWRDELWEKFGLQFRVFSRELEESTPGVNPFNDIDQLIVRLDQVSRSDDLREKLCAAKWDLVIFDEAHKLAAHFTGQEIKRTKRFTMAEQLGAATRHLLLMTATPHNGKEEDYQLFLSLLDADRFYGRFRDGVHRIDASDLMRRMVKEELIKFDNTPLFPERKAYTANYQLSDLERDLYERVTNYVRNEMGKADSLDGRRKGAVGFALTSLQRRLASSPEAIFQSLRRRRERLQKRMEEERVGGKRIQETVFGDVPDDDDDLDAAEQEALETELIDDASAAQTMAELEAEVLVLQSLVQKAQKVVASGNDRKWDELSKILQHDERMKGADGRLRKLIVFTEHRDTLNYLVKRVTDVIGNPNAIVTIHGGTPRDERQRVQGLFRNDKDVRVLIATDAAGEGVNLQVANLMVNYDLPWNPNRLEQRFGRIHRIGQTEVCHLWNLVAKETREGEVYHQLLVKLAVESAALKGRVFDILGEVFDDKPLRELLIDAIRYGDRPDVKARLFQKVDHAFDHEHLRNIMDRNALAQETMSVDRLFRVREDMEKAEARRLQPHFVRAFFTKAFTSLGGTLYPREAERYEITHVPTMIRDRDRHIMGRNMRDTSPVLERYERVCFVRDAVKPLDKPTLTLASMLHPGHPLMLSVTDLILEKHANLLRQGAVLVDPSDEGTAPHLLFLLTHEIKDGSGKVVSKRLQFVRVEPDGRSSFAGWAPHLDLEPLEPKDRAQLESVLAAPWLTGDLEHQALVLAASTLAPDHFKDVADRRIDHIKKTREAVHKRLTTEIDFWTDRYLKLKDDIAAGKDVKLNADNAFRTAQDLQGRLESRTQELKTMEHIVSLPPIVVGGALVVPAGLLRQVRGDQADILSNDPEARARIEWLAMAAVRKSEEGRGCRVEDVSAQKCGWDLTSYPPAAEGKLPEARHLEVKGRIKGATTVSVTRNEMICGLNQEDKFALVIVLVNENDSTDGPFYVRNAFEQEPGWGVSSVNYKLDMLLSRATSK